MGFGAFPRSQLPNLGLYDVEAAAGTVDGLGQRLLRVRAPGGNVILLLSASATTAGMPTAFLSVPTLERGRAAALAAAALAKVSGAVLLAARNTQEGGSRKHHPALYSPKTAKHNREKKNVQSKAFALAPGR